MFKIKIFLIICTVHVMSSSIKDLNVGRKFMSKTNEVFKFYLRPKIIRTVSTFNNDKIYENIWSDNFGNKKEIKTKKSKVFNLFPVPVDGECLSNDGRKSGICLNVYECRLKGGIAKGDCSMGFGVCCIFEASCGGTISNNVTYLVSPNFPSSMPNNFTFCKVKVQIMDTTISQLRIDFNHFSLGQPNRKTGVCDGDVFNITGGPLGTFSLCGQNSGQHIYYDINGPISSSTKTSHTGLTENNYINQDDGLEIILNFTNRLFPIRFWEIRILQIPFSQRAPNGCLQYFIGIQGVMQTFNFADNGRHLANQNYRSCIRQESNMCSIMYQPCDDQSFKIGPTEMTSIQNDMMTTDTSTLTTLSPVQFANNATSDSVDQTITEATTPVVSALDNVEGSGEDNTQLPMITSRRPVRGGFDILSFFRSAFNFKRNNRSSKQFVTSCKDRITMPCIIEDFVGVGFGPLPSCEPVHCGSQFCSSGTKPCRIESTVTPFYLGVHFGDGIGKGNAEDNIGACIQFSQMQCI